MACAASSAAEIKKDYKVVAYYISWAAYVRNFTPENIQPKNLTHINFAFANIKDGQIAVGDEEVDIGVKNSYAKLQNLKKSNPHLKTLISVGGWGWSKEYSNIALTQESRNRFADSIVVFIKKYGFDGVDIAWEYPVSGGEQGNSKRPEDRKNFTYLLQALKDKLNAAGKKDKRPYLLTAALGTEERNFINIEVDKVLAIVDWANLMTYDFNGFFHNYAGHNAPLFDDPTIQRDGVPNIRNVNSVIELATEKYGAPANKLVMGVPFYGYSWRKCGRKNNGQHQDCQGKGRGTWEDGILDFSDIEKNLVNKKSFVRHWNDVAKVPYLFNAESGEFISYDDLDSLDHKIRYIKEKELGGAMFWEITADRERILQDKLGKDLLGRP